MAYTLYSHDGSGGFVVEAGLVKAGADYGIVIVDTTQAQQMRPDYVALNPLHQVPALILPDGTLMTESAAIAIHLSLVYPDKGLGPPPGTPEHGAFLRWMVFMSVNLYEPCLRGFYPERYAGDADCVEAVKASGGNHMRRTFALIEDALDGRDRMAGAQLGLADVYLAMLMQWGPEEVNLPGLKSIADAVIADDVYGPLWRRHGFRW